MATITVLTNANKATARANVNFGSIRDFVGSVNISGVQAGARVRIFAIIGGADYELDELWQSMPLSYTCEGFSFDITRGDLVKTSVTVKLTEV